MAVNFEKAFDTLNFDFLLRVLHKFKFCPFFIQWIPTLYKNVSSCVKDIDKGLLKMLDIESIISARRVIRLKKFLEDYPSTWKSPSNSCILSVSGSLILDCNFDTVKLKTQCPKY